MSKSRLLRCMLSLLLGMVCSVAWAQPTVGKYYKLKNKHDSSIVYDNVNNSNRLTAISGDDTTIDEDYKIWYLEASSTSGKYTLKNKGTEQYVTPGSEWKTSTTVAEFYLYVRTSGSPNYYNLSSASDASGYTCLHCWIGTPGKNWTGDGGGSQYEFVEVEVPIERNYSINIEDGLTTIKIGETTYENGDTYTVVGKVTKGDITVVAPDGQFAAVSIDNENGEINVYFATIPEQTVSATYENAVVYPAQQTAVGDATSSVSGGVYTLGNNVLAASFAMMGDDLYFAGSKAMDLLPGTEPFTVAFGSGDVVPASAMTLTNVELQNLDADATAIGGAEHYAGKALVANYEYTYNGAEINIVWRAVLRNGSHYLRTEMELTGVNDVDMYNVIPMIYNVDTEAAGSTPATVGNTRGAVLMSNKIFAGLETPTAYNTVGDATGDEDNWNLTTTLDAVTIASGDWTQMTEDEAELVKRVEEATGATYPNLYAYQQTGVALTEGQKVVVEVKYTAGSHKLYLGGVDLLSSTGSISASDYHEGYTGSVHDRNTFSFIAPSDGTYTIRAIVHDASETIDATSKLTTQIYTAKEGVVIDTDIVGIQGRWSRNTTLAADETWKVGAVVGLIAQDGSQANSDIHSTQKRRSFLAYSERERAVPWRANPVYISWYELNINRNNAAPGSESSNMTANQVLDVLAHWKTDMYDRYGVGANMYVIDDGWDEYGEWTFHDGFPNEMRDIAAKAKELGGAGVGAWLGPVGGYGESGTYRRQYWTTTKTGGMQLSNPEYYAAFKKAATNLVCNQDGTDGYQKGSDNYTFFKFDGISAQFSATGPDAGDTGNENAEGIIRLERFVREELREDIFFNTTVGTWASPFWYQITDATWRQENDHGEEGTNTIQREKWITYRDRLVYQNYVKNSPICPINTLMTHGFILTKFGPPADNERDYNSVRNELRCAFLCGSGMVELYNDYDLMNSINGGALWADLAECIAWQKRNEDVLPDAHWVGGHPWNNTKEQIYGWAAWNGTKSTLALRNGAPEEQSYTFTLRQALNIPANVSSSSQIVLRSAFGDQAALTGLTEGKAYGIDESITVTLPGSSVYGFEGIASDETINNVSSIALTTENSATEVEVDETLVVKAAVNSNATFPALTWTSSDTEIATVSGGLVVPKKAGTVTITATANDGSNTTSSVTLTILPDMEADVVTDLRQLSNEKVYTLSSTRGFLFYRPESTYLCCSTGSAVGSVTLDETNPNHQFRIEKIDENYYLYSVGAEKYVAKDGTFTDAATDALTLTDVSTSRPSFPWQLALGGNGINSQASGQNANGIVFNSYNTTDDGNCYTIEVGVPKSYVYTINVLGAEGTTVTYDGNSYENGGTFETKAEFTESDFTPSAVDGKFSVVNIDGNDIYVSYFADDTQFYTIQGGHGGYLSLSDGYHTDGDLLLTKTDVPKDKKGLWTFVDQGDGVYKIYNYTTGLSKVIGITGSEAAARASMVDPESTTHATTFAGTFNFNGEASYLKSEGTTNWWNKRGDYLAYWNYSDVTGDTGSKFFFEEVDYAMLPDEYIHEISNIAGVSSFTPKNPNTLWYTTSAEASGVSYPWMEYALPLGNGELGCMVFGGVAHEELQFNEKTLWSGPANTVGAASGNRTFMNFGSVIIANNDASIYTDGVTDYVRYLDIEEGIAGVQFRNAAGTLQTRKYLSSAPDQVIAGQYTSEGNDINLTFTLEPGSGINASDVTYENGMAYFSGAMTVEYAARLHVVANDGATVTTSKYGIKVENASEVTFYLKGATNFEGNVAVLNNYFTADDAAAINTAVEEAIEEAETKGYAAIEADHITDFTTITKRMTLDLGLTTPTVDTKTLVDNYYPNNTAGTSTANDHLFLEQLYFHFGRYLAISSNRQPIAAPNNLQGIWNDRGTDSPWNSDIHTNINIQMNYWPTEITNLSDLHEPYLNFIIRGAQSDGWKAVGTNYNEGYGWSVLTESSLYNSMSTWGSNYLVANVWYTSHLWMHYRYTQDKEFLKEAFPIMWSAAEFWFHRLKEDEGYDSSTQNSDYGGTAYSFEPDGTYVAPNEYSAEQDAHNSEDGTAHAQQMISYLFQNLKEAIDILGQATVGLTDDQVATLNDYLEKTDKGLHTEIYTANTALNAGWTNPRNGVAQGDTILREWKYSPYDVSTDPGHRHLSHLMALFPLDQITPESEYFTPAVNSLKLRGDAATGWSMGWKVNLWARAQDGDHAHLIIKNALKHSTSYGTNAGAGGIYYNLFDSHAPFQIDGNFGVCSGIAEMLMQSAHGYINILPALPAVWESQGTITGMKAIGNFTVDFNWKNGKAQTVTILSNAGAPLKVRTARGDIATALITVDGVETAATITDGIATIPCTQGQTVVIDFREEAVTQQMTAPEDGYYVIYSESSIGEGWVYYNASKSSRKYRVNTEVDLSTDVTSEQMQYVWKLTNNKSAGTFTLQNVSSGLFMPADAARNQNMSGTATANLAITAVDGKEGFWYINQTNNKNGENLLYIHTNSDGEPNLSYWDSYSADGTSIRASFYKVNTLEDVTYTFNYVDGEGNPVGSATYSCLSTMEVTENVMREYCPEGYAVLSHTNSDLTYTIVVAEVILTPGASYYIYCDNDTRQYFYNNGGSLAVSEKRTHFSKKYLFTCTFDGQYYQFKNQAGKYLGHKGLSDAAYNFELREYNVGEETRIALYSVAAGKYFVMDASGSFNQADKTYDAETTAHSTSYKFEEYTLPKDGETYYIYSDTYQESAYVPRYLYADGSNLKLNTAVQAVDAYQWTATVTDDGYVQFQNGAGKYLKHKGIQDTPYNFTLSRENVHHDIAATLYSVSDSRYFVVKNDGTAFDQSTGTYNQETQTHCSDFVFIPVSEVKLLTVDAPTRVKGTATWNGETKDLPASWLYLPGTTIVDPALSVTIRGTYTLTELMEGETSLGTSTSISELTADRTITVNATPAFFSSTYGEKWVRLSNCSNASYWATLENTTDGGNGKTATLDFTDEKQMWCLVGTADNFVLYNKAAGETLALNVPLTGENENNVNGDQASLSTTQGAWKLIEQDFGYALVPTENNASNLGINMWAGTGGNLKVYATAESNKGSYWTVDLVDYDNPLTISVAVDKVWESSPRVAELTVDLDGQTSTTRILGNVAAQTYYLPVDATFSLSSMTYRGYTFNGFGGTFEDATLPDGGLNITVSYTANDERTLFYSPSATGHPYRIPAIATAPNGDVFAICDHRPCGGDIGNGDVDLVCRISTDNGVTWGDEFFLANGEGPSAHTNGETWKVGFGDPAIVADRESNEVLVMSVCGNRLCWDGNYGVATADNPENPNRVARIRIKYDEATQQWVVGDPEEVTYSVYPKFVDGEGNVHVRSLFIGAGKICQSRVVKKDQYYRIYCSVWAVAPNSSTHHNYVIYSDDFGDTWEVLGDLGYANSPAPYGNEPKCEELPDGTVVLSSRVSGGRYFNLFTFDNDGTYTTGSWGEVVKCTETIDGSSQGTNGEIYKVKAIRKSDGQICDVMLQSVPAGPGGRYNVTVYYKEMAYGENNVNEYTPETFSTGWAVGKQVSEKYSAYSTMILQADGRIGFFFEEAPNESMIYIPYTLEDLTAGNYSLYTVNSTIGQYGIGTFYASEAMQIPEGVKAYATVKRPVIDANTKIGTLTLEQLTGFIPAKTGAVLLGGAATYEFVPSISYGTAVEGNLLVGFEADDNDADSYAGVTLPTDGSVDYVLAVKNDVAAFYRKAADFKVYNNKAYLQVPAIEATALRLRFVDADGTTSLRDVMTDFGADDAIYDLQGRRVQKAGKGVYIINGQKVLR